jgi:hypothetical protein
MDTGTEQLVDGALKVFVPMKKAHRFPDETYLLFCTHVTSSCMT